MNLQDGAGRASGGPPDPASGEPVAGEEVAEIDLERASWDAEYRRRALALLRRARGARPGSASDTEEKT